MITPRIYGALLQHVTLYHAVRMGSVAGHRRQEAIEDSGALLSGQRHDRDPLSFSTRGACELTDGPQKSSLPRVQSVSQEQK
jgi:hypothetical protein